MNALLLLLTSATSGTQPGPQLRAPFFKLCLRAFEKMHYREKIKPYQPKIIIKPKIMFSIDTGEREETVGILRFQCQFETHGESSSL